MSLVSYDPNRAVRELRDDFSRLFGRWPFDNGDASTVATSQWVPAVDIREEENRFLVEADVPGVNPDDIEVTMENGALTIRGERSSEVKQDEGGYRRVERVRGTFYRRFLLPETADPEKITATNKNGVLVIEIGKSEKAQPRRIPIKG